MFNPKAIELDYTIMSNFVRNMTEKQYQRKAEIMGLQERYNDYENLFFDALNASKKKSIIEA
jgi:hypothetical protein